MGLRDVAILNQKVCFLNRRHESKKPTTVTVTQVTPGTDKTAWKPRPCLQGGQPSCMDLVSLLQQSQKPHASTCSDKADTCCGPEFSKILEKVVPQLCANPHSLLQQDHPQPSEQGDRTPSVMTDGGNSNTYYKIRIQVHLLSVFHA